MTAQAIAPVRNRAEWAEIINGDWRKSIESIIQTGVNLVEARAALGHGQFEEMVSADLDFGPRTARGLMQIAKHPSIINRNRGSDLPARWTVLRQLAQLKEEDFEWAHSHGLITSNMSRGAADAIRVARGDEYRLTPQRDVDVVQVSNNRRDLPTPAEARNIARETNRLVAASDGNLYSGATEEEGADYVRRREQTYRIIDAVQSIAKSDVSPDRWLDEAKEHWLTRFDLHEIETASNWLGELCAAYYVRKGIVDAE